MKKKLGYLILGGIIIFCVGLFLVKANYDRVKKEIILNNNTILLNLINNHPELELEIIDSIKNIKENNDFSILNKYNLDSLESLDYLNEIKDLRNTLYITYIGFYFIIFIIIFIFVYVSEKRRKKEILKIDKYLFTLLSNDINIDLKDFQTGDLTALQNDLMKVTSRLKNALESSTNDKKELSKTLADISHQLKTPLTSLLIINDNLSSFNIDDKTRNEFLKKQEKIILHMKGLIISLLKVSQIESGTIVLKKEPVNLANLFDYVILQLDLLLVAKNINLEKNINDKINVLGDFNWLAEAFLNILKNACEHSKDNGQIEIAVEENPMFVEVRIKDYGEGINKQDLKHIFERFYKSSADKESIGIGLNLSKTIFERSSGTIKCESELNKYTLFIIKFYKNII